MNEEHSPQHGVSDAQGPTPPADATRTRTARRFRWAIRAAVLLLLIGLVMRGADGLFYYPSRHTWYSPREFGLLHEAVTFEASDGVRLSGWFLPATTHRLGPGQKPGGTVVHFHGNAANITNHVALVAWLPPAGFNVLMFDYRGFGESEGRVTRAGTVLDGHAAIDYALSRPEVDPQRLFLFGQSLGGAVATVVAAERPEVRAVVLDATFSGYRRIAAAHLQRTVFSRWLAEGLARLLISSGYEPLEHVEQIAPRPLLVIASPDDSICFAPLGRELYEAAAEPKKFILLSRGEHLEGVVENVDGVQGRIVEFLDTAGNAE